MTVHRRVVELVVARVDDPAGGRVENDRGRVRNRVRHADERDPERAEVPRRIVGMDLQELGRTHDALLVEFRLDEPERQPRCPDLGDRHLPQKVREAADVVFVAVRQHDGADAGGALAEVREIRQDEVDAEMLVPGEREARVDDDDRPFAFDRGHVLSDLAQAAQGDDPAGIRHQASLRPVAP